MMKLGCLAAPIAQGGVVGSPVGWGTYLEEFGFTFVPATNAVPAGLTNLTAIAGGNGDFDFSLGLTTSGTVIGWGDNEYNETNVPAALITAANESVAKGDAAKTPSVAVHDYLSAWQRVHPKQG